MSYGSAPPPPPPPRLRAFAVRVKDTIYQAATDGFIAGVKVETTGKIKLYVEDATPPTILPQADGSDQYGSISWVVKKDDYYKLWTETAALELGHWVPLQ